jgi:hypothetical protein
VNVNVAVPLETPVMIPPFVTVATEELLLDHAPPELGESELEPPTQSEDEPVNATEYPTIFIGAVGEEAQPA